MKTLSIEKMECSQGGDKCSTFTGVMCAATVILLFSGVFAPVAGSTGIYCALGIAGGCGPQND